MSTELFQTTATSVITPEFIRELNKITGDITRTVKAPKNDALRASQALRVLEEAGKTSQVSGMSVNRVNASVWFDPEPGSVFGGPGEADIIHDGEFALELDGGQVVCLGGQKYAVVLPFEMASEPACGCGKPNPVDA